MIVWRLRGKIVRTVSCCVVYNSCICVCIPVQVVQGDLLIGIYILSREMDIVTLKVVLLFTYVRAQGKASGMMFKRM